MQARRLTIVLLACILPTIGLAETPTETFQKGLSLDLAGTDSRSAHLAFLTYLEAAQSGLPDAQFNVAVMLDSGRGVASDLTQAAIWYARAALHGNQRASYDLGQLYETGQGVPMNKALARAWFAASDLPAAFDHLKVQSTPTNESRISTAPTLLSPTTGETIRPVSGSVDLVWTANDQPAETRYFVELCSITEKQCDQVISQFSDISGLIAALPANESHFAWRVYSVDRLGKSYQASDWASFEVAGK